MKIRALFLLAILSAVAWARPMPNQAIVHEVVLDEGGIPEHWSPSVPGAPWLPTRVDVDLELTVTSRCAFETWWYWSFKPRVHLISRDTVHVTLNGVPVHDEQLGLHITSEGVSYNYDGVMDFDGPSGTTVSGSWWSNDPASEQANPALWQQIGMIPLEVDCPGTNTGIICDVWSTSGTMATKIRGVLRVTYWP